MAKRDAEFAGDNPINGEEWREIIGHPDYAVSSAGRIKCLRRRRYLRPGQLVSLSVASGGYVYAALDGGTIVVHRLVCTAFHGPQPDGKPHAAHNNGVRHDNRADNLRWASVPENAADIKAHGTANPPRGEKQGRSKLKTEQVREIIRRRAAGERQRDLAAEFGVSRTTVNAIVNGYNWKHLEVTPC